MIEIVNRELLIPREEFNIGTNYDNNSETRVFHLNKVTAGGIDISNCTFALDMKYANGTFNAASLIKEVSDDDIKLTLNIVNSMLQVPGTVLIQIRALNDDGNCKWASYQGALFVEDSINVPAKYIGKITELETLETQQANFKKAEDARNAAETARDEAEKSRAAAEEKRESTFKDAIDDFNSDRQDLKDLRNLAESYAHGNTGVRDGENTDNSQYYSDLSRENLNNIEKYMADLKLYLKSYDPDEVMILYHMVQNNDFFAPLLDSDGNTILDSDENAIFVNWKYVEI